MWSTPSSTARRRTAQRGVGVARRPEHAGAGELHGAEADPADGLVAELGGECRVGHALQGALRSVAVTRRASIVGLAPPPSQERR